MLLHVIWKQIALTSTLCEIISCFFKWISNIVGSLVMAAAFLGSSVVSYIRLHDFFQTFHSQTID